MPRIKPFAALRYARKLAPAMSDLVSPPYDVLNDKLKAALARKHPNNIVSVDLPHLPAKSVGPDATYVSAATTLKSWIDAGVLDRDRRAAIYAYSQTYDHFGRSYHRRGLIALVMLSEFGEGKVIPHERTYPDAIVDRLKLTKATGVQMSPVFGLFHDPRHEVNNALYKDLARPEVTATLDGVRSDLWSVTDAEVEDKVMGLLSAKPIYIADGHHRYTMALQYKKDLEAANGGPLPPTHPANYCMFLLVGMQDDGLIVLPTHRMIGGLPGFHIDSFRDGFGSTVEWSSTGLGSDRLDHYIHNVLPKQPPRTFGVYDGRERKIYQLTINDPDPLAKIAADRSEIWRKLDVAVCQRYLIETVLQPRFAAGKEITPGYTADPADIPPQVDGQRYQLAILLAPTPLASLVQLGKSNEVMPPKSTYFYPKPVTGMVMSVVSG